MFNPTSLLVPAVLMSCLNVPPMYVQGPPRPAPLSGEQGGKPNWELGPSPTALPAVECWALASSHPSSPWAGLDRSLAGSMTWGGACC